MGVLVEETDGKKIVTNANIKPTEEEIKEWCKIVTNPIELDMAWFWECPDCGQGNFERSVICEMTGDERFQKKLEMDIPLDEKGEFVAPPEWVECPKCGYTSESVGILGETG